MPWTHVKDWLSAWHIDDWLTVVGLAVLAIGAAAQFWAAWDEYRELIDALTEETKRKLQQVDPVVKALGKVFNLIGSRLTVRITYLAVAAAITLFFAPRKMAEIQGAGGAEAAKLAQLVRIAAAWVFLMEGAMLVLIAAVIHVVVADL
jgi:hypothetical protein